MTITSNHCVSLMGRQVPTDSRSSFSLVPTAVDERERIERLQERERVSTSDSTSVSGTDVPPVPALFSQLRSDRRCRSCSGAARSRSPGAEMRSVRPSDVSGARRRYPENPRCADSSPDHLPQSKSPLLIYLALHTILIVSKQLYTVNRNIMQEDNNKESFSN